MSCCKWCDDEACGRAAAEAPSAVKALAALLIAVAAGIIVGAIWGLA